MLTMSMSLSAQKDHSSNLGATQPIISSLLAEFNRKLSHLLTLLPHQYMSMHSVEVNTVLIYQQIESRIKMQLLSFSESLICFSALFFTLHDKI